MLIFLIFLRVCFIRALLTAYPDHLVILKVFAPWCRACKGLEPKFKALVADNKYAKLPMIWADLTIQHNKDFVKTIGVLALPTIQFYVHGQRLDTFPCGPSKVPILKQKLTQLVTDYIDASTLQLKPKSDTADVAGADGQVVESMDASASETSTRPASTTTPSTTTTAKMDLNSAATRAVPTTTTSSSPFDKDRILQQVKSKVRSIPYFRGMLESEFESLLDKTQILTFEAFSVIMKQGNPGRTFYYIVEGEVEICQRTSLEDPLATPPQYLGTVINRFEAGDYFGERALITGEPRAASIRASRPTTCLAFDREDFEASCVLSGKSTLLMAGGDNTNNDLMNMDDRYGVAWNTMDQNIMKAWNDAQYQQAVQASQTRGSVNRPREIDGVDNDLEVKEDDDDMTYYASPSSSSSSSSSSVASSSDTTNTIVGADPEIIVPLLLRFKLIRLVTRCFDYIVENRLRLGDEASQKRRMLLVNLLSIGQQAEIRDAFSLLDNDGDGEVTLDELKRCMQSVGDVRSEEELVDFIDASHVLDDGKQVLTYRDFFGIMAEVEFYNLFLETFAALDHRNSGFVRAKDLDRVLCGIRDLVTGDRFSIIDVEDTDMMVDYEQFSKMLLGGESLRT